MFAGLVGVANVVVLLAQAPALVRSLLLNADNASTFVLPALAGRAPAGSVVNLGNHPWYEPWWLMRATAGLPDYRQLWEAAPFVLALLGIAVAAACAWWALGRLAGLLCAVALLAASEPVRGIVDVPESHGLIVLHVAVLCIALLFVCGRAQRGRLTPVVLVLVGVPLVVFTGAGLTDELLLVSGLGPFVQIDSWYAPRPDTRTFLLTDTRPAVPPAVSAPPANLGQPVAQEAVGEGLTVYVYGHDIASDISV